MDEALEQPPKEEMIPKVDSGINFFGMTNYRNQNRKFGIKLDDRRRHMYVVGKTGMGKTTLLENMVLNDIYAGHGVGVVDPHGDFAEKIVNYIPSNRINDVVYFNPADIDFPIGFNILETIRPEQKHLVASGLMGVFKKIWPDVWSARMEYILNNTILALLDFPGTTLLGINRMLADEEYRRRVVNNTKDPVVKAYWQTEFANYTDKFRSEAVSPIQNKIGQFLSASVIRNIVAQVKSRINIREIMDSKKIFIMNLSKGRIGEDNSRLLGGMLITKIQLSAMERVDILEKDRNDFFLYVDEFQNFATESFANILSEARKYRLDLIMAHQYMEQLDEMVLAAVIGNVGTMVTYRVGSTDAEILAKEYAPTFTEEDLVNLPKYQVYLKLMIDGVASRPFSATTLPPIGSPTNSTEKVVRVSRERYATSREKIEEKIMRWSGMITMSDDEAANMEVDEDEAQFDHPVPAPKPAPAPAVVPVVKASQPSQPAPRQSPPQPRPPQSAQPQRSGDGRGSDHRNQRDGQRSGDRQSTNAPRSSSQGGDPNRRNRDRDRDRDRNKKRSNNPPPGNAERVLLVDPSQKGISLSQMLPKSREEHTEEPAQRSSVTPDNVSPEPKSSRPIVPETSGNVPSELDLGFLPSASDAPTSPTSSPVVMSQPTDISAKPIQSRQAQRPSSPKTVPPGTPVTIDG